MAGSGVPAIDGPPVQGRAGASGGREMIHFADFVAEDEGESQIPCDWALNPSESTTET